MSITSSWSHIRLYPSDVDRSVKFYEAVFGFETIFDMLIEGPEFEALMGVEGVTNRCLGGRIGDMRVEFNTPSTVSQTRATPGVGGVGLTFQVDDADAAQARCDELGIPNTGAPTELLGVRIFFVEDPDGVKIEVVQYLPGSPAWAGQGARPEAAATGA